jgi:hypothetical protein
MAPNMDTDANGEEFGMKTLTLVSDSIGNSAIMEMSEFKPKVADLRLVYALTFQSTTDSFLESLRLWPRLLSTEKSQSDTQTFGNKRLSSSI